MNRCITIHDAGYGMHDARPSDFGLRKQKRAKCKVTTSPDLPSFEVRDLSQSIKNYQEIIGIGAFATLELRPGKSLYA